MVDDTVLPAARHLTGPDAHGVLEAAVTAAGGRLESARACHLHYRPGRDMVVRYDSTVRWAGAEPVPETLIAATTADGAPAGTLPIEAVTDTGDELRVGVWRWPFDPVLVGLDVAVTPSKAHAWLGDELVTGPVQLTVVAYRPTQRAVVRLVDAAGQVRYLKALSPRAVKRLAQRHDRLAAAGLPVPEVIRRDTERGVMAMTALAGPTVRDRIKRGDRVLPGPDEYESVFERLAAAELPVNRRTMGRVEASVRHAAMLATVLDGEGPRLERLTEALERAGTRAAARPPVTIHGDLYEAQLVTGEGRGRAHTIAGILDLDDAGPGDPLDDRATVLGHLLERLADHGSRRSPRVAAYVNELRTAFGRHVDLAELDEVVAAVMVGLATGPFRMQHPHWAQGVGRRLAIAERLLDRPGADRLEVPA